MWGVFLRARRRHGSQPAEQLVVIQRLHEVIVESRFDGPAAVLLLTPAGERDNEDVAAPGARTEVAADVVTAQRRQTDVEYCDVRQKTLRHYERLGSIVRG